MSAVDEIREAIDNLTELKARSTSGPWKADVDVRGDCVLWGPRGKFLTNIETDRRAEPSFDEWPGKQSVMFDCDRNDAFLMETLHRTIDAQLAILNSALTMLAPFAGMRLSDEAVELELTLARAINGGTK